MNGSKNGDSWITMLVAPIVVIQDLSKIEIHMRYMFTYDESRDSRRSKTGTRRSKTRMRSLRTEFSLVESDQHSQ